MLGRVDRVDRTEVAPLILLFRANGEDNVSSPVTPASSSATALNSFALCVRLSGILTDRLCPLPGASAGLSVTSSIIGPTDSREATDPRDGGRCMIAGIDSCVSSSIRGSCGGGLGVAGGSGTFSGLSSWMAL